MVLVKAKYKTLLREVCGGIGTDQVREFELQPLLESNGSDASGSKMFLIL